MREMNSGGQRIVEQSVISTENFENNFGKSINSLDERVDLNLKLGVKEGRDGKISYSDSIGINLPENIKGVIISDTKRRRQDTDVEFISTGFRVGDGLIGINVSLPKNEKMVGAGFQAHQSQ